MEKMEKKDREKMWEKIWFRFKNVVVVGAGILCRRGGGLGYCVFIVVKLSLIIVIYWLRLLFVL